MKVIFLEVDIKIKFDGTLEGTSMLNFLYLGIICSLYVVTRKMVNYTCIE